MPSAGLAQSAGDNQYDDPFDPSKRPVEPAPARESAPAREPATPAEATGSIGAVSGSTASLETSTGSPASRKLASASATGKKLPRTGSSLALSAALGLFMLASGLALRLRLGEPTRRRTRAGPVGS